MAEEVKKSEAAAQTAATMRQEMMDVINKYAKELADKIGSTEAKLIGQPRVAGTVKFDGGTIPIDSIVYALEKGVDPEKVKAWLEYQKNKAALGQRFAGGNLRDVDSFTRFLSGQTTFDPEQLKAIASENDEQQAKNKEFKEQLKAKIEAAKTKKTE